MDEGRLILILCLTVLIGAGLPAVVFYWAKRENTAAMVDAIRKASSTASNPWKKDEQDLQELSRRVEALKIAGELEKDGSAIDDNDPEPR